MCVHTSVQTMKRDQGSIDSKNSQLLGDRQVDKGEDREANGRVEGTVKALRTHTAPPARRQTTSVWTCPGHSPSPVVVGELLSPSGSPSAFVKRDEDGSNVLRGTSAGEGSQESSRRHWAVMGPAHPQARANKALSFGGQLPDIAV